jgi:metallo-beta-lactamase class B
VPRWTAWLGLLLAPAVDAQPGIQPDPSVDCTSCEAWNEPLEPFHVHGNTWYVGTAGLSAILIDSGDGLILVDAALPQSAPQIAANIRRLGFDPLDIRYVAVSHAHYDHVGGVAAFQRLTGAEVLAGREAVNALNSGRSSPEDPQHGPHLATFPAVRDARVLEDGEAVELGNVRLQAIATPGHTPGGTSWTWQSCEAGECLDVVYADSLSPVSAPGYRFTAGLGESLRASALKVGKLDCDIFLSTHDFSFRLHDKLAAGRDAFIDPAGCAAYAESALERLERRLRDEREGSVRVAPSHGK